MTWPAVLDAFAARLDAVAAAAARGAAPDELAAVPPFAPPTDLGPLPADQVGRATLLLEQAGDLEQRLRRARDDARGRLEAPAPRRGARSADPAYLDLAV